MSSSSRPNPEPNDTVKSAQSPSPTPPASSDSMSEKLLRPQRPARPVSPPAPPAPSPSPAPVAATEPELPQRPAPIPPPSEPKQFRAIGVVRGRYVPSEEQLTQGHLETADAEVNSVLLGRVMSLVKNHINLDEEHVWVVYPRTGQKDGKLHLQIVGVWEPETLQQEDDEAAATAEDAPEAAAEDVSEATPETTLDPVPSSEVRDGYFSVRGEVVFYSEEDERIIVKIRQSPRKNGQTPKFFKIQLKGKEDGRLLRHFWSFEVQRQGEELVVQTGEDMGPMPPKKKRKPMNKGKRKPYRSATVKKGGEGGNRRPTPRPRKAGEAKPQPESARES